MKFFLLLTALCAVANAHHVKYLHSEGVEEVVYKYYADVRTAALDPHVFASQFKMRSDLHIRDDKAGNGTIYWLKNIEIYAYNGEKQFYEYEVPHWTPLPKESEEFLKPFYVGYDEKGLAHDIMFQKNEPEWTLNVKKAIASLVQLDFTKITTVAKDHPYAFHTTEETIYGKCDVSYEVVPTKTEYIVTKYMDPKHCDGHVEQIYTNIVPTQCHTDHDDSYRTPNKKVFHIGNKKSKLIEIDSSSKILMYPFKIQDNLQVVYVNQTLKFVKDVPAEEKIDVSTFVVYYPIHFTEPHIDEQIFVPDYTFGKKIVDKEALVTKVKEMFYEAVEYLQEMPINKEAPDTKQGLVINRILKAMKYLDVAHFEKIMVLLQKGTAPKDVQALEMFYKMLPNIGTRPSAIFIKDLIAGHKVKDYVATSMLYTLGVNMHVPNEKLLVELEEFINWEDKVKPEVRSAAVLAYATLVYETYKEHENDEHVEKYIKIYYKKMTEATKYEEQLLWMQGLSNIRIGSVYQLLRPIVLGEPVFKYDRHLRVHAIWNILHPLQDKHEEAFEIFWPVMVDEHLHIELRVAALKGIMRTGSVSQMYFVFQYMQTVNCPHLYNYFFTGVKALAHSEIYCDIRTNITTFSEQVEQYYNNAPVDVSTKVWTRDYIDEEYDYGFSVYGNSIADEKTNEINQIYFRFNSYISNHFYNNLGVHIKFEGIEYPVDTILDDLLTFNADTFKGHLFKKTEEPIHIEIIFTHHEQVVFVKYIDEEAIKGFFTYDFFKLVSMMKYQMTSIIYPLQGEVNVPTDVGFTAQFYTHVPVVLYFKSDVPIYKPDQTEVTIKTNKFFRIWRHGTYGVNIYNPLAIMTQGVRRVFTFDLNVPITYQLTVNFETKSLKVIAEKDTNDAYNVIGVKTHVLTQVISVPDPKTDIMSKTCADCHQYVTVTRGEEFKHETEMFDYHTRFNGLQYYFGAYDCEQTSHDFVHHGYEYPSMTYDFLHEFGHVEFKKFLVHAISWFSKEAYLVPQGSCGLVFYARPCAEHGNPEHFEFTVKFDRDVIDHDHEVIEVPKLEHVVVPHHKNVLKVSFLTKDHEEHVITDWQGDIEFKHLHGNLFNELDIHFWRRIKNSDDVLNWCLNREKKFFHDKVEAEYVFTYGYSHKNECINDEFKITVDYQGEKTEQQRQEHVHHDERMTYTDCQPHLPWEHNNDTSYNCMYAHTTVRHYKYHITYQHVPKYFEEIFENLWHHMIVSYQPSFYYEADTFVGEHSAIVEVNYPMAYDHHEPVAHIAVNFAGHTYDFEDFPVSKYWWFSQPDSVDIPLYFRYAKFLNKYHVCAIFPETPEHYLPHHHLASIPTKEWQMYAADHKTNYTWAVYVQKTKEHDDLDELEVKFVFNNHWIVIKPKHDDDKLHTYGDSVFSFTTDDKMMRYITTDYDAKDMYGLKVFYVNHAIFFTLPDLGMIWTYDGHRVRVITTDIDHEHHKYHGKCYH